MTGIFIFVCAVIMSTCVSNPYAHAWPDILTITLTTEETEVLTSPNYPGPYENNIDTIWFVTAPAGFQVLLRFNNFTTEENNDTVTVRDGWTSNYSRSILRASPSGWFIPGSITSMGSYLWIRFASNEGNRFRGFQALLNAKIPALTPSSVIGQYSNVASIHVTTEPTSIVNSTSTSSASSTGNYCITVHHRLKHVSSQGIAASAEPQESPGMRHNPTFESSTAHDLRMTDIADCHGGNDPYMALTTPNGGPTVQVYEPLREVNSQGDGYEVPINGTNGQTGTENDKTLHKFQVHPETDYEITHEYQDLTNSVFGRNNSLGNDSPVRRIQVKPETDYKAIHEYEDPGIIGRNISQYESHIIGLQEMSQTDFEIQRY